ncbi:uncharacterized protein C7orf57 homolog isoform X2 [Alosa sapidissima]|uniref:uncharacterized protein C7orf57 homolog isoform X2 n=1 Tax=Alosa sapidissima TaxID=34773 RepID=UPI001C08444E|nr:uncharacterized protein C7orf57 homolog isoform X2 [Alosa sapidissima]
MLSLHEDTSHKQETSRETEMGNEHKGDATPQGPKVTSQIPGLSLDIQDPVDDSVSCRRLGVFETDSNYVKLAKQGGHKGLLRHEETDMTVKTNAPYKPPDWFCVDSDDHESSSFSTYSPTKGTNPRFLVHQEFQKSAKKSIQPLDIPFGSDNKSAWERDADSITTEETLDIDDSASKLKKLTISPKYQEANKFRKQALNKNPAPVSMSKLLSFGYLEEDRSPARVPAHNVHSKKHESPYQNFSR